MGEVTLPQDIAMLLMQGIVGSSSTGCGQVCAIRLSGLPWALLEAL